MRPPPTPFPSPPRGGGRRLGSLSRRRRSARRRFSGGSAGPIRTRAARSNYSSPLELLVATILSAQCTDVRVNMVTPALFRKYKTAADYARAPAGELEDAIRQTGFFNSKAKSLRSAGAAIAAEHGGRVPDTMEALVALPGVGRKTANVILGNAFGKDEGFVVDTHVGRVSRRLGFTRQTDPVKVEEDLNAIVPKGRRTLAAHQLDLPRPADLRGAQAPLRGLPGPYSIVSPDRRRMTAARRVYLSGAIEHASDGGRGWREEIGRFLRGGARRRGLRSGGGREEGPDRRGAGGTSADGRAKRPSGSGKWSARSSPGISNRFKHESDYVLALWDDSAARGRRHGRGDHPRPPARQAGLSRSRNAARVRLRLGPLRRHAKCSRTSTLRIPPEAAWIVAVSRSRELR